MDTLPVIKKGYSIDLDKIKDGFLYSPYSCTANSRNEAKSELLKEVQYEDLLLTSGDKITYITLPIKRNEHIDLLFFEGEETPRHRVSEIIKERKRNAELDAILNNDQITHCYIYKRGYYRPGYCGYTDLLENAGVYLKADAISHARGVREITIEPINAPEHNKMIQDKIKELESKLIPITA